MSNIQVKIICDSVSSVNGVRLTTFELVYPRIIHSELMTHRMLSRNAASSRAIPFDKIVDQLDGKPVRFGQANPGMQDKGADYDAPIKIDDGERIWKWKPVDAWEKAKEDAVKWSKAFKEAGYHKQVYNRLTEPFQSIKVIVTATEWANFFWLRNDVAADPTLQALAQKMEEAYNSNIPVELKPGEWHLPFVDTSRDAAGKQYFWWYLTPTEKLPLTLDEAIKVSAARCAAVSFRNTDYNLEKSLQVYERLVGDERKHGSSMEHQASVMINPWDSYQSPEDYSFNGWEDGVTHADRKGYLWSGNFRSWVQYRQLIPGQNKSAY